MENKLWRGQLLQILARNNYVWQAFLKSNSGDALMAFDSIIANCPNHIKGNIANSPNHILPEFSWTWHIVFSGVGD